MPHTVPPAIFAVGRNYAEHAVEMKGEMPERPVIFMKNPASVIGPDESIRIPAICDEPCEQVDFEGELAIVIGRDGRDISMADALDAIAGYAIANDVSARWWQKEGSGGQWVRGKSFDTFCPLGPLVPREAIGDPQDLTLITRLNGDVMQQTSTSLMLFPVVPLVADLSRGMTLLQGTVILTGTPAGVGAARTPPRFLRDGDVVEVEISGLGVLRNPVIHA